MAERHEKVRDSAYASEWRCECGYPSVWRVWTMRWRVLNLCQRCYEVYCEAQNECPRDFSVDNNQGDKVVVVSPARKDP